MSRIETIGAATLYLGDCLDILPTLGGVNAIITSPPYDNLRDYGGHAASKPDSVITLLCDRLTPGGVIMWNVADQVIDGSESGASFRQAIAFMEGGLRLHDTMIYCKAGVTFPDANRYHPAFEYMFIFSKGAPKHFNGIKDWMNKWRGSAMHGTDRQPSGETTRIHGHGNIVPTFGLRRNWWPLTNPYTGDTAGHPAPMPYAMASDHIITWTDHAALILDPFMGSGTTGVACARLGRKFIGIEIEPKYFDIACKRIDQAYKQPDMFIKQPEEKPKDKTLFDPMEIGK